VWPENPLDKNFVEQAAKAFRHINIQGGADTFVTQLRKVFHEIVAIDEHLERLDGPSTEEVDNRIAMLAPRIAYYCSRNSGRDGNVLDLIWQHQTNQSRFVFSKQVPEWIAKVQGAKNSEEKKAAFKRVRLAMEAMVAYGRASTGRKKLQSNQLVVVNIRRMRPYETQ
jgi:CRISPR type III-A-associated protein Csm2